MDDQAAQGHRIVRAICAVMLATSVTVVLIYLVAKGPDRIGAQMLRLFFSGLLAFALNRGDGWARWTTVTLMCIAGVLEALAVGGLATCLAVIHLALAGGLAFPPAVTAFFASRAPAD